MNTLFRSSLLSLGFYISLFTPLYAFAEAADRDKPIELEADTVTVNDGVKRLI